MSNPISSLSSRFLWKEMPQWKGRVYTIQLNPWKLLGHSYVVENKAHFKLSFGQSTAWLGEGGGLTQRTSITSASKHSHCCHHIVRLEKRAKFRLRPKWHGKSQVRWHDSGILLGDITKCVDFPKHFNVQYWWIWGAMSLHSNQLAFGDSYWNIIPNLARKLS